MQVLKVNMIKWYIIIMVCCTLCVPKMTGAGTEPARSLKGLNGSLIQHAESIYHTGIYFAQNDPKKPSNADTAEDLSKTKEKETPSKPRTKHKSAQERPKQIKPFVPSEKIPADQGVDFPYDI